MDGSTSRPEISSTFAKGLEVLRAFEAEATHLTIGEISGKTGLDRSVVRRLVMTLVHLGYVCQRDSRFSLTPRVLMLAGGFLQSRRFGKTVQPMLDGFAAQAGEALSVAMREEAEVVYVAHSQGSSSPPRIGFTVGSRVPLLTTAVGRALLALEPADAQAALIASAPLASHTDRTLRDRDRIACTLVAPDAGEPLVVAVDGEFEPGIVGLATGIRCESGLSAAVGLSGERERILEPARRAVLEGHLVRCADALSGLL